MNRRWKAAEKKPPTQQKTSIQSDADAMVDEILTARTKPSTFIGVEPLLIAPEELEEDDNFLVKARRFEDAWNKNDEELVSSTSEGLNLCEGMLKVISLQTYIVRV